MATTGSELKKGIVLRVTPMKETDAMVTAIGEEGLFSFYARGIKKMTSKNGSAVQSLCLGEYLLSASNDGKFVLKEAKPERILAKEDLSSIAVAAFIQELTLRLIQEEDAALIYPWLYGCLDAVSRGFSPLTAGIIFFAQALKISGLGLEVSHCVRCQGKTKIAGLSLEDGGFVCENCLEGEHERLSQRMLKIARYLFMLTPNDIERVAFEAVECNSFFAMLSQYLDDCTGLRLKSLELLSHI